jgi:choline dehydrogenase-like flavoprotein
MAAMVTINEDQPLPENRVELGDEKDEFGFRRARIVYKTSGDGIALWNEGVEEGKRILKAAGAKDIWNGPKVAQHIMGGTIMGGEASKSVTNAWSQTHDLGNLFIGGPSVFPTSSCANSTFTLHAVAMMSAEYLSQNFDSI